jgi:iron complex outermembrane receptor protein
MSVATATPAAEEGNDDAEEQQEPVESGLVERVEVSATWAKEREAPASFTDLTREEIAGRNRGQDLAAILADSPNAYAYSDAGNRVGYTYLSIRGFDQRRVAVNINGVPLNTPESRQVYYVDLADFAGSLERIQIQRGPGTAVYGSPAVGGVVNLETGNLPSRPGGEFRVGGGSFGTLRASMEYGSPLGDGSWAWRIRLAHVRSDGYRDPSWTRHSLGHLALHHYAPDSIWRIHLFGGPEETQLAYFGLPVDYLRGEISGDADRDRRVNFLAPGEIDRFVQPQLQVHNDRRIGDGLFLSNTWYAILGEGYFRQYSPQGSPLAFDPQGKDPSAALLLEDAWRKRAVDNAQVGWIPRVTWNHALGTLTGGMELLFHRGDHRGTVLEWSGCTDPTNGSGCADLEANPGEPLLYAYRNRKDTYVAFARQTFRPTADLAIHAELQVTHHRYAMRKDEVRDISFDADYTFLTPRVGANWNIGARWNLYGQLSTARSEPTFSNVWNPQEVYERPASRFGGFDPASGRFSDPYARPERLRSYEAGLGYSGERLRIRGNLYWMDFRDEFVFAGGLDEDGLPLTENAGSSVHRGVELELSGRLPGNVDLGGHAAVSDDVFRSYTALSTGDGGETLAIDYSGNRVALFPEYQVRLRVSRAIGPARLELGARRVGTIYTDNSENERKNPLLRQTPGWVDKKVSPYTVWDLRASLELARIVGLGPDRSLRAEIWVDNLLNDRFETFGYSYPLDAAYTSFYTEYFPAATRGIYFGLTYGF